MTAQRHFHDELNRLKSLLAEMAELAEVAFRQAVEALLERDPAKAERVWQGDRAIDDLELEIDDLAINLLALQQPLARDLRLITMAMKISNDLERVGDHAVNIARETRFLLESPPMRILPEIEEMTRLASAMLRDALDAFITGDNAAAREIVLRDDRVDELHTNVIRIMLTHMMEDPRKIGPGMDLIFVSRNLERIADLATNIAEDIVFMVEGRTIKHNVERRGVEAGG
jgi:phosphate transport system protein